MNQEPRVSVPCPARSGCRPPRAVFTVGCLAALLVAPLVGAGNWPGWRGSRGNGSSDEKDLPLTWGGKKNENLLWKAALDGRSYSSPIVWGEHVFLTTADKQTDQEVKDKKVPRHHVLCFRAHDGKRLWETDVPAGKWPDGYYAIPTPVSDGKRVYAWFGSGVLAALDFDGKIVWRWERPGPYSVYPGVSSSPVLFEDTILILCDQSRGSFLLALDRDKGEVKWEQKRPKMRSTNSSPVLMTVKGKPQLLVAGGNALQGIDPSNGEVIWWCGKDGGYWTSLSCGSGLVYTDSSGGRGLAVDPTGKADVSKTHVKWSHPKMPEGLGAPLIVGDHVYRAARPGILKCWKLATGEEVYSKRLDGLSFLASPFVTADGRIYFASPRRTYVIKAGPNPEVLAKNELVGGGDDGPSAAVSGGRIFLKTTAALFCIGKK